jgi:2-polyprenyl-6-methoxyphenol hydroxylase-like FAD-dependent oxidoreductase
VSQTHDAIVIGAGPAGSSLALRLAQQGRSCLLLDGARFPRPKVCGEGLMPHGIHALAEVGLDATSQGHLFSGIRYRLADGTVAEGRFPDGGRGVGLERSWLDTELLARAEASDQIEVRTETWVQAPRAPGGSAQLAEVELPEGSARAPILIAADGCRSPTRRTLGLEAPAPKRVRFGVGAHFDHASREDPFVEVFLGPGYELYTTPVSPTRTNVALLTDEAYLRSTLQGRLEAALLEILASSKGRGATLATAERVGPVRTIGPLAHQALRAHGPGVLLVGDAAGALDPITGEGLSIGLATSAIAAEVLEGAFAANDFSARRLAAWTRRRRQAIRGLEAFTRAILFLSERPELAGRAIRNLAQAPETFSRLLGVAAGGSLASLRFRDGLRLLAGV